jgi:ankyrin repeat protein
VHPDEITIPIRCDDVVGFEVVFESVQEDVQYELDVSPFEVLHGLSLLAYAAEYRAVKIIEFLIVRGATIGISELTCAINSGDLDIFRRFVELAALPDEAELCKSLPFSNFVITGRYGAPASPPLSMRTLLVYAVKRRQNRIAEWIVCTKIPNFLTSIGEDCTDLFESSNFSFLRFLFKRSALLVSPLLAPICGSIIRNGYSDMLHYFDEYMDNSTGCYRNCLLSKIIFEWMCPQMPRDMMLFSRAASVGRVSILELLLKRLFRPNLKSFFEKNLVCAFCWAIARSHIDLFDWFISHIGASALRNSAVRLLGASAESGSVEIAERLLPYLCERDDITSVLLTAELYRSCTFLRFLVKYAVQKGLSVDLSLVLSEAIIRGDLETANFLLAPPCDVKLETPIHALQGAIENGSLATLRFGFKIVEPAERPALASALLESVIGDESGEIIGLLHSFEGGWRCSLAFAARTHSLLVVRSLLSQNDSPDAVNHPEHCGTALCVAAAAGDIEIVELLLSIPGINTDLPDCNHRTPFVLAARNKHLNVLRALGQFIGEDLRRFPTQLQSAFLEAFQLGLSSKSRLRAPSPFSYCTTNSPPRVFCDAAFSEMTTRLLDFFMSFPILATNSLPTTGSALVLLAAETRNHILLTRALALPNVNPNDYTSTGATPLILCCENRDFEGASQLLSYPGISINWRMPDGYSALVVAAETGHLRLLQSLISAPTFSPDLSNAGLALIVAIQAGRPDACDVLLGLDFDINAPVVTRDAADPGRHRRRTALKAAVFYGRAELVRLVLTHPRFAHAPAALESALFCAAALDRPELIHLLLPLTGGDPNLRNHRGESLLTVATLHGARRSVTELVEARGFSAALSGGIRVLAAVLRSPVPRILPLLRLLVKISDFDVNEVVPRDVNITRVLRKASRGEVATGTQRPIDIPVGGSLLSAALRLGRGDVAEILFGHGAIDPSIKDEAGRSILFDMVLRYAADVGRLLGFPGIDLNEVDNDGNTVLHWAIINRAPQAVEVLVTQGIDISVRNARGQTAWELAHAIRPHSGEALEYPPQPTDREDFVESICALLVGWF